MKSKFYTSKHGTRLLLASGGQIVLETEIHSTYEHYRLGKKRGGGQTEEGPVLKHTCRKGNKSSKGILKLSV